MKKSIVFTLALALIVAWGVVPAMAYNCPVQIKQAEEVIKKAEAVAKSPETQKLLAEAKKLLSEAKGAHEQAKGRIDHGDAVRKAKTAQALAEEIEFLTRPQPGN